MDVSDWIEEQDAMFYAEETLEDGKPGRGFVVVLRYVPGVAGIPKLVEDVVAAPVFETMCEGAMKECEGVTRLDTGALRRRGDAFGYGEEVDAWIEDGIVTGYDAPEASWFRALRCAGYVDPKLYE